MNTGILRAFGLDEEDEEEKKKKRHAQASQEAHNNLAQKQTQQSNNTSAYNTLANASSSKSFDEANSELGVAKASATVTKTKQQQATENLINDLKMQKDTLSLNASKLLNSGASMLASAREAAATQPLYTINETTAEHILDYSHGDKSINSSVAFWRLKNSDEAKTVPQIAVIVDELEKGTYKGTAQDIVNAYNAAKQTRYNQWYEQNIAPIDYQTQKKREEFAKNYGQDMANVADVATSAGTAIAKYSLAGAAGLSRFGAGALAAAGGNAQKQAQELKSFETDLDQVARDNGVDMGIGGLYAVMIGKTFNALNKGLGSVLPGLGNNGTAPVNVISKASILLKNTLAGMGAAYTTYGTTGTLRNIYNASQGRKITEQEAKNPWWSEDALKATLIAGALYAASGTASDLKKVEAINELAKGQGDLNYSLDNLQRNFQVQVNNGQANGAYKTYEEGANAIKTFFKNNYVGKATDTLEKFYLTKWRAATYGLEDNALIPMAGGSNVSAGVGPVMPTQGAPTQTAATQQSGMPMVQTTTPAQALPQATTQTQTATTSEVENLTEESLSKPIDRQLGDRLPSFKKAYVEDLPLSKKTQKEIYTSVYNETLNRINNQTSKSPDVLEAHDYWNTAIKTIPSGLSDMANSELNNYISTDVPYFEHSEKFLEGWETLVWRAVANAYKEFANENGLDVADDINLDNPYTVKGTDIYGNDIIAKKKANGGTKDVVAVPKKDTQEYYDLMEAVKPMLDEKKIEDETLKIMDSYDDIGSFDDRTLNKIDREATKKVFDEFLSTDMGKRVAASYKNGELQPLEATEEDYSGGYTALDGTPITNGIAKWADDSATKEDSKLVPYYHGSPFLFEEFKDTYTHNGKSLGDGYYLTKNEKRAKNTYAYDDKDKVYKLIVNVKNPFNDDAWARDKKEIISKVPELVEEFDKEGIKNTKFVGGKADYIDEMKLYFDEGKEAWQRLEGEPDANNTIELVKDIAKRNGIDTRDIWKWLGYDGIQDGEDIVIFDSNQAKYLDNPNPTNRPQFNKEDNKSSQGSFPVPEKLPKKILGSQRKFLKEFKQVGYIDINGNKIESVEDFVDLCQIFRDPLAETTRFVLLNDDDIVVGETAITSYSVNHVSWGVFDKFFPEIEKAAKACGATKFYFMHNHPSGDVEASAADKNVSKATLKHFNRPYSKLKYLGDVIIDHNKYTHIKPLNDGKISITENIKMKTDTLNEIEQYMSDDGWTKMKINSRDMIAQLASLVTNKEDYSSLMLLNYHRMPMLLQELPNQFFYQKSDFLKNYIKDLAKRNGAAYACIGTTDPATLQEIGKKKLQLQDAVCYEPLSDGSINIISSLRRAGKLGQETIFKRANKHENVLPTKDSPKFNLEEARKAKLEKKTPDKAAFKQRIIDELKGIHGVDKVTISKENKQGNWGVFIKGKQKVIMNGNVPTDWRYETYIAAQENGKPVIEENIKFAIDLAKEELKQAYEKPKGLRKKEAEKKPVPKTETKSKGTMDDDFSKRNQELEKITNELRDKLAKQEKDYEKKLAKKDEEIKGLKSKTKEQNLKRKVRLEAKKKKDSEEKRFKSATPKGKLRMLGRKIEKQTGYYEINNFPELDETYEREFGKTIRQTLKTLHNKEVFPYLPKPIQEIVDKFASETYLKANWKTFDKYLREALEADELRQLIENTDAPIANRLLELIKDHEAAPITIKTAKEMYDDLQILSGIVDVAEERMSYKRRNEEIDKTLTKAKGELEELEKWREPKKKTDASAVRGKIVDGLNKAMELPKYLKTEIQSIMGGNPDSALNIIWKWFDEGNEKFNELEAKYARNFDEFVEPAPGGFKYVPDLEKALNPKAKPIDTGIKGSKPNGEKYEENLKLTKPYIMHIVASSRNQDNLMGFSKILLGKDENGKPVYSEPGGYIVPDEYWLKRGDIEKAYLEGKKYVFTSDDIKHLESLLTPVEKDFVDACLKVGKITAEEGNKVSQKLIGRDIFTVDNYVRIIRDKSTFDGELIDPAKLENLSNALSEKYVGLEGIFGRGGSLEARNHRSRRAIYGEPLKQAVENSFNGAKKYIAYALPLYDTNMLLKSRYPDTFEKIKTVDKDPTNKKGLGYYYIKVDELPENGAEHALYVVDNGDGYDIYKRKEQGKRLEDMVKSAGGKSFFEYYNQFVDRILGKSKKTYFLPLASLRAKVVLNANLSVAAKQFGSYFMIGQFLNHPTKSMLTGLLDVGGIYKLAKDYLEKEGKDLSGLKGQEIVNQMLEKVTFMNTQRGLGKFSHDVNYIEPGNTILGRVNSGRLISLVDKLTVDATFRVLIKDILADGYEFGTDEFFKQLKQRVYTVYQSNPQYSSIYKTPLQNDPGSLLSSLAQFNTVMIMGYNNLAQAGMARAYYKATGDNANYKKANQRFRRSVDGIILGSMYAAAMGMLMYALMGKKEDKKTPLSQFLLNTASNMLSYTIIGDEIISALANYNNYDLTTNELSWANNFLDTLEYLGKAITEGAPSDWIKVIKTGLSTIGVPTNGVDNIMGIIGNMTNSGLYKKYAVLKDKDTYKQYLKNEELIDGDIATFYDMKQTTNDKTLEADYGWIKNSKAGTYNSKASAKSRAIRDVLGYPQDKKLNKAQEKEYNKWYEVFKNS